jgi:hypothetical protein
MPSSRVLEAVAVTAELCGRTFSPAAAAVFVGDLSGFPDETVLNALARCRREVRGVLTVSDVISRIDDGRPGPEEAWAMLPRDEKATVVWTDEMIQAWAIAQPMLDAGEDIPARMAFKETYVKLVSEARDKKIAVHWQPSLGHDTNGRAEPLQRAVEMGRLSVEHVKPLLPAPKGTGVIAQFVIEGNATPLLESMTPTAREKAIEHIAKIKEIVGAGIMK